MMIGREEVQKKSEELRVHTSHVQRDYIFGWILSGIYSHSDLGNSLVLKGGNGFRKAYFEKARYSPDLDFATLQSVLSSQSCLLDPMHHGLRPQCPLTSMGKVI